MNKEMVIEKIKNRVTKNESLRSRKVMIEDSSLFYAARKHFKTWGNAVIDSGFEYEIKKEIKPMGYWTKEKTIEAIHKRIEDGLPLNRNNVLVTDGGLLTAILKHFNTYEEAMNFCGLEYDNVREDISLMSYYGMKFEKLLGSILKELNIQFTKDHFKGIQPDYIFPNSRWADAKLSAWTETISQSIEKYEPFCDKLTIIYLRGNKNTEKALSEKTTVISVYKFLENISMKSKTKYVNVLDELWKQADDHESKIEKVIIENGFSHYRGVAWRKDNQKWTSAITYNNKRIHIGVFESELEAAIAHDDYIIDNKLDKPINFGVNVLAKENHQSKYFGVSRSNTTEKWISSIQINKNRLTLGTFHTETMAAKVYNDFIFTNNIDRPVNIIPEEDLIGIDVLEVHRNMGKSKYKGISWNSRCNKWKVGIFVNKKRIFLGYFILEIDAINAFNKYICDNDLPNPLIQII